MFCKFLKEKYQKLAKYYNEIRTSPNAYYWQAFQTVKERIKNICGETTKI